MKERDIRPEAVFNQFLALAERDTKLYFGEVPFARINCPACDGAGATGAFRKHGFSYETCSVCKTLFVNPRPGQDAFRRYYQEAPSVKFWATDFYEKTESARRERLFAPRALAVMEKVRKYSARSAKTEVGWIGDVGAGYGVFCEEIGKIVTQARIFGIEPSPELASVCRQKGISVVPLFVEDAVRTDLPIGPAECGALTSFELLEHVHNPKAFLESCKRLLKPGELLILTTLNGLGLDIQVLWEKSKSVHPPHHINFLNPGSIKLLLERTGFQVLEVSTPGKLDISILENSLGKVFFDRFWENFLVQLKEDGREQLQQFVVDRGLSSHMMVVAQCQ
ncbi:MAG: class I SAM-dependent methyltransferase [Nitrospiraceae bacterium]